MKKLLLVDLFFTVTTILFIAGCATPGPSTNIVTSGSIQTTLSPESFQAPMIIDKTFTDKEIHVNLVKFIGKASSEKAKVTVNDIPAIVGNDGAYYVYLDLAPGENSIVTRTTINQKTTSNRINVTFSPPLIVNLDWPWNANSNSDYTKVPLSINGVVSNPAAKVTLNQAPVVVNADGTFSFQTTLKVGHNPLVAEASLRDETDTDGIPLEVSSNGKLGGFPPGLGANNISSASLFLQNNGSIINIKAGETVIANIDILAKKDIYFKEPSQNILTASVVRTSNKYSRIILPSLPSLTFNFVPPNYKLYPKIEYHSFMVVKAALGLAPGDYYFTSVISLGSERDEIPFTVIAK